MHIYIDIQLLIIVNTIFVSSCYIYIYYIYNYKLNVAIVKYCLSIAIVIEKMNNLTLDLRNLQLFISGMLWFRITK